MFEDQATAPDQDHAVMPQTKSKAAALSGMQQRQERLFVARECVHNQETSALAVDTFRTSCSVVWCENNTRLSEIFSRQNVDGVVLSGGIESMRATRRPEVERLFRLSTSHSQREGHLLRF